jgi:hypothetical protein
LDPSVFDLGISIVRLYFSDKPSLTRMWFLEAFSSTTEDAGAAIANPAKSNPRQYVKILIFTIV